MSYKKGGVVGVSEEGDGVAGVTKSQTAGAIVGVGHRAAVFSGSVGVDGNLLVSQTLEVAGHLGGKLKTFRIDHPLDPANKYLSHASIESSEVMNLYTGNVSLDERGEAVVKLPDWFEALNEDFRYQLTPIGESSPNLHIAEKIHDHKFTIAGGSPGMEVSWLVTAVRHDAWILAHPLHVEEEKQGEERGTYLDPELFGQPAQRGLAWIKPIGLNAEQKLNLLGDHADEVLAEIGATESGSAEVARQARVARAGTRAKSAWNFKNINNSLNALR